MAVEMRLLLILRPSLGTITPDRALKDSAFAKEGRVSEEGSVAQHCIVLDKLLREY